MEWKRRSFLGGLSGLAAAAAATPAPGAGEGKGTGGNAGEGADRGRGARPAAGGAAFGPGAAPLFPGLGPGYLDSASHHPMMAPAAQAVRDYATRAPAARAGVDSADVRARFARLIHAEAEEIAYAPSTSMGENLVAMALDLPQRGGRIVTDALHFIGSFYLYEQLGRQGMDVVVLPMEADGSISLRRYEEAMTPDTRLIAVSHMSWINGFCHDLRALSALAHDRGAFLYADLIQSAGNTPVDVKALGVDFAACGTYKWLMGDFGLAFLYADKRVLGRLKRPWYGYWQTRDFVAPETHLYPFDPPGSVPYVSRPQSGAGAIFNGSFPPRLIEAGAGVSLDWLLHAGVEAIAAYRQPMVRALQEGLRARGFRPYTPAGSTGPIVSFLYPDATRLNERLARAGVRLSTYRDRFRIAPSFFNDMNDIDRAIEALGRP